jgi:DNA-binding SARP family transcriptional activator/TolB-like protein/Flp pilus assembly protein TadD
MESLVESTPPSLPGRPRALEVRLLGPMTIRRGDAVLDLPSSRKVRGLFAYLAFAPLAVPRSLLCELLWDVPNDPRGELRWCLSKIRSLVDEAGCRRVETRGDTVRLNLEGCFVDAFEVLRGVREGVETLAPDRLRAILSWFAGDFVQGLEIDRSPAFNVWLMSQRRRLRSCHVAVLEHMVRSVPASDLTEGEGQEHLEKWLELAPFDRRAHALLLQAFAARSRIREGEEHVAVAVRQFEAEGLDPAPIRDAWRAARAQGVSPEPVMRPAANAMPDPGSPDTGQPSESRRASIAVLPVPGRSLQPSQPGGTVDALVHDVISRLAKLRSLFVIAQGTAFALRERGIGAHEAGRVLDVDYVTTVAVRLRDQRIAVDVELVETRAARIVWADTLDGGLGEALLVLDEIGDRIVASLASEIETAERNRAILKPPNSLDAWEAHHRGLWHMYRFNKVDNEHARRFFEAAIARDPTFARAYSGLSFTHFQNAFQGWAERSSEADRAFEAAGQSLMADDRDPAAHWAMGRALWLRGRADQSMVELGQAIDLSPNFAQGHYSLAFVQSQAGDPAAAISSTDHSRHLSPFDPMLFAMLATRAVALLRLGRLEEAADWSVKAASRPNAHAQILAIAALSLSLAGRLEEARTYVGAIRKALPSYGIDDFLMAMRFDPEIEQWFRKAATRVGMD